MWGHPSHGVLRTFWYARRMQSGATRINVQPNLITDASAIAVLDGENGIGQVITKRAMTEAIGRACEHGIGAVAVRNSGHFGTAMYFTKMAAERGCIGLLFTNASPAMAPWGGREKLVGNNPWSIAAPAGKYPAMMLDIANTAVARGKLYVARQRNEKIPADWATDIFGVPTDDPAMGIAGNILPMAGHKGYAIATVVDMLSGILSGSSFLNNVVGPYEPQGNSGVGHLAMAIDIASFRPLTEFNKDMENMVEKIKAAPLSPGTEEIFYPGELEAKHAQVNLERGISIPDSTVDELNDAAKQLGVPKLVNYSSEWSLVQRVL